MKKIVVLLILVLSVFTMVACNDVPNTQYWIEIHNELSEIYNNEEYSSIRAIEFSQKAQEFFDIQEGNEIQDIYMNTLNTCLSFTLSGYDILLVVPNNNDKSFYNQLNSLKNDSIKFIEDIKSFNRSKEDFEERIVDGEGNLRTGNIVINDFLEFKRNFLNIIEKAYSLTESFNKVYTSGHINLDDVQLDEDNSGLSYSLYKTLSVESCNLKTVKSLITVLKEYDCRDDIITFKNLFDTQKDYYHEIKQGIDTTGNANDYNNCKKWLLIYTNYKNELNKFNQIVNKIDFISLSRDYDNNIQEYAKDRNDSSIILQYNYAINFYEMNQLLINETYSFCNVK